MRLKFPELICRTGRPAFANYSDRQLESNFRSLKRKILLTDTANEQYSVIIFPAADTFSFSAQHGFKGKAEKIEVRGLHRRVKSRLDSNVVKVEQQSGQAYEEKKQSERSELLNTRLLVTERWPVILVFIVLVGIILIGWGLRRGVMKWFG